jgi:transposase
MSATEQRRAWVLNRLGKGEVTTVEAAGLLGLSERQVWRLRAAFEMDGPAGSVHGNRGRASPRRTEPAIAERVVGLAQGRYAGCNDCQLAELLAEHEGITLGRVTVRRILRSAGVASPRRRRPPRHRSRRERMPQEGLLIQLDGSRHDWHRPGGDLPRSGGRGRLSRVAADDRPAQGHPARGLSRSSRDLRAGDPADPRPRAGRRSRPVALAGRPGAGRTGGRIDPGRLPPGEGPDRAAMGNVAGPPRRRAAAGRRSRSSIGEPGPRHVPAALQPPLRRPGRRPDAGVAATATRPATRPGVLLKYRRRVASDHTVRLDGQVLQLPPGPGRVGYAGRRVEVHVRLDGRIVAFDGERELVVSPAPPDASALRSRGDHRAGPSLTPAPAAVASMPAADHPWRTMSFGKAAKRRALTDSLIR